MGFSQFAKELKNIMRFLIADDHAFLRQGLIQILKEEFPHAQFHEAAAVKETLDQLANGPWAILILDLFFPTRNGFEVLEEATRSHPELPVLMLSSAPEEQMAFLALKAGARGYINKRAAPGNLIDAVKKLLAGGTYVTAKLAERLASEVRQPHQAPHEQLTEREFQVMQMLVAGKSLKEIAAELFLSVKTISTFHIRIWAKLGVKNDVDLVHYALNHRLTERAVISLPLDKGEPGEK